MKGTPSPSPQQQKPSISATRVTASTVGGIVGLAGMEHGFLEMLQGNVTPSGLVIDAIGPAQKLWPGATEPAFTIIPNFFVTGILAMIVGLLVTIWAVAFVQRRHGALILLLLSIMLFLVGGGSPPIFLGVVASAVATRINKPLKWWHAHLSVNVRGFLAKLWPWSVIAFVFMFWFSVVIAITGWPLLFFDANGTNALFILSLLGYVSDVIMLLVVVAGFASDIQRRSAE
ncbi:MAG TPA: hypothetical protein VIH48_04040 [Candidatus Bathyarchaeia archaeon]